MLNGGISHLWRQRHSSKTMTMLTKLSAQIHKQTISPSCQWTIKRSRFLWMNTCCAYSACTQIHREKKNQNQIHKHGKSLDSHTLHRRTQTRTTFISDNNCYTSLFNRWPRHWMSCRIEIDLIKIYQRIWGVIFQSIWMTMIRLYYEIDKIRRLKNDWNVSELSS